MKDQNVIQAMNKYLLKHTVGWVQSQSTTEMRDRRNVPDWDKLSTYDQDDLHQLAFVVGETFAERELQNHFLH